MNDVSIPNIIQSIKDDLIQLITIDKQLEKDNNNNNNNNIKKLTSSFSKIFSRIINNINKFEQDPSPLDNNLPVFISILTDALIPLIRQNSNNYNDNQLFISLSQIYYTFSKIFDWKKLSYYLKVDIHLLNDILNVLKIDSKNYKTWYMKYLLLSWLYTILLSPFKFDHDHLDIKIINLINLEKFNSNKVYQSIVANILAELYYKNKVLILQNNNNNIIIKTKITNNISSIDLLSLNYFWKKIISNINSFENEKFLVENETFIHSSINQIINIIENKNNQIDNVEEFYMIVIKIMPKLFFIELYYENWSSLEDIISWYLLNLNSNFTEFRFCIAHSFQKLINLITKYMESYIAIDLVNQIIDKTIKLIKDNQMISNNNNINIDQLHSQLIIIAELSNFILEYLPTSQLLNIINTVLPITFKFQILNGNTNNSNNTVSLRGNQIKDATNFICWSLIRNKNFKKIIILNGKETKFISLIESLNDNIFINLLMNSLFDKDFIIRKSSNAALQEYLGRINYIYNGFNEIEDHSNHKLSVLILDNFTIMKLIELKFSDINRSYKENLILLYKIFHSNNSSPLFFNKIINWFINYNIFTNLDYQIVKLSIESLRLFIETIKPINHNSDNMISNIIKNVLKDESYLNDPPKGSRLLYLITELNQYLDINRNIVINLYDSIVTSNCHITKTNEDFFKLLSIMKYWNLYTKIPHGIIFDDKMINFLFKEIIGSIQTENSCIWYDEFSELFNQILKILSNDLSLFDNNENIKQNFFKLYHKYMSFNNELVCASLPSLPPKDFFSLFEKYKYSMSCQCKASLIRTLTNDTTTTMFYKLSSTPNDTIFTDMIYEFLDDHTTTDQGDVGRLVREEACILLDKHFNEFQSCIQERFALQLLYLLAEPSEEISLLSLKILQENVIPQFEYHKERHNLNILLLRERFFTRESLESTSFKNEKIKFWQHYAARGGAFHSTDQQITSSIDAFITWYDQTAKSTDNKISIFHELIHSIPSAAIIIIEQNDVERSKIIKTTLLCFNFIIRLISSNVIFDTSNWNGILIKMHNLLIINGSSMLKSTVIKFLPYLVIAYSNANENNADIAFTNSVIDKLFNVVKKYRQKKDTSSILRITLQSLTQIYLEYDDFVRIECLKTLIKSKFSKDNLNVSNYYIHA